MTLRLSSPVSALLLSSLLAARIAQGEPTAPSPSPTAPETAEPETELEATPPESAEPDPSIIEPALPEAKPTKNKRRKPKVRRPRRHIPFRAGAGLLVGGILPDAAPVVGFAFRGGLQRNRWGFMLEGGLSGALGGALTSGDVHSSRSTLFYHGYIAPTAELTLPPLFVSLGVPLGVGMWSATSNTVDALGTVQSSARSTIGVVTFIAGLDARVGRHFGTRHHHLTVALGTKVLFAKEDEATSVVPQQGAIEANRDTGIGLQFVPTFTIGYDYL
jgi:hypothetical protein